MKKIIPQDTRYVPLTQQVSCCVPTSISMVMYKLGIPLIPMELLGYYLGLVVNKDNSSLFWQARTGARPKSGYGTQILKKKFAINSVFKKLHIPLKIKTYHIDKFKNKKDLVDFINSCVKQNEDLIVLLNSGVLNSTDKMSGHACVVDRIYPTKNIIRLIDPSSDQAKWREFKIDYFIKAVKAHPTKSGRFMKLEKIRT